MQYKDLVYRLLARGKIAFYRDVAFEIGRNIASIRANLGISQYDLAEKLGTKQPSVARLEKGTKLPSLSFLQRVADALGHVLVEPRIISKQEFIDEYLLGSNTTETNFSDHYPDGEALRYWRDSVVKVSKVRTDGPKTTIDEAEFSSFLVDNGVINNV